MALPAIARAVVSAAGLRFGGAGTVGGVTLTIRSNIRQEARKLERVGRINEMAIIRALNLAARKAATQTRRDLASEKNIPQRVLRKRVQPFRARRSMKPLRSSVWIGTGKPIKANEIGAVSQTAGGRVKLGKRTMTGAFVARMPTGHQGVFTRKPQARHRQRPDGQWTELPIQESAVQLMPEARRISRRAVEHHQKTTYPKEYRRQMALKMRGAL